MAHITEKNYIQGQNICLRPMKSDEFRLFYKWATKSDATPFWFGDQPPSYVVFKHDWPSYFFDGSKPELGRCFIISAGNQAIGQINYNEIDRNNHSTQLDILIANHKNMNKGYGTEAIDLLVDFLFNEMHVHLCWVDILSDNFRAHKAFQKAQFNPGREFYRSGKYWIRFQRFQPSHQIKPYFNKN